VKNGIISEVIYFNKYRREENREKFYKIKVDVVGVIYIIFNTNK